MVLNQDKKLIFFDLKGDKLIKFNFANFFQNVDLSKIDITKINVSV